MRTVCLTAFLVLILATPALADPDWKEVGQALGKPGSELPGGIYRIGLPRFDLKVTLDGVNLKPAFALGGWVAFEQMGDRAMVMGDLVLTENEVGPVMQKFEQSGIEIAALHNHLLRSNPSTLYMHVVGQGDAVKLAQELHDGLALSKTPFAASAPLEATPAIEETMADLDKIMGAHASANGGVVQYSFPRAETITDNGMPVPPAMGSAIAINFQLSGANKAAITGDFVLTADEVNPVLQTLRKNGIEITALHSHMLNEQPRLFFMHFWANDNAKKLASGLRTALDKVNLASQGSNSVAPS
jgi:biotin operon repressor